MARSREELQKILENVLGSRNVYFQPPESLKIKYPAIVYSRTSIQNVFADNSAYKGHNVYQITVIDNDPDSELVEAVLQLPLCSCSRCFISDNLYHNVFTIYF